MKTREILSIAVAFAGCGKLEIGSYADDESDHQRGSSGQGGATTSGGTASSGTASSGTASLGGATSGSGSGGRGGSGGDPGGTNGGQAGDGGESSGSAGDGGDDSGVGGGQAGDGSAGTSPLNRSCRGREHECVGHSGCCASRAVGPEEFTLGWDQYGVPATVSRFYADALEVTVGRFVNFVDAYDEWRAEGNPTEGAGEHLHIPGSGWQSEWSLPVDRNELEVAVLDCNEPNYFSRSLNVEYPMNCVNWYVAFAFCIWDGKRLLTEAEWELAAKAGREERKYPWGDAPEPNSDYAVFDCRAGDGPCDFLKVGSTRLGDSREGLSDLGGSVAEWIFDQPSDPYQNPCNDCANIASKTHPGLRGFRGGGYSLPPSYLVTTQPNSTNPDTERERGVKFRGIDFLGLRCARSLPD